MPREELVHQALEVGRQVLDDHERHPVSLGQVVEEALERFEPAGGGADSDDVRWGVCDPKATFVLGLTIFREVKHRPMRREWPFMLT